MDKAPNSYARPFIPLLLSLIAGISLGVHLPGIQLAAVIISIAAATGVTVCSVRRTGNFLFVGSRIRPCVLEISTRPCARTRP